MNCPENEEQPCLKEVNRPKLLLISLDWTRPKDPPTPLSLAFLAANIKKHLVLRNKVQLQTKNFSVWDSALDVYTCIVKENPNYVAWGVYGWNETLTHQILWFCQEFSFHGNIILGGPQITYGHAACLLRYPGVDFFIRGEGETPLVQLLNHLISNNPLDNIKKIPGVVVRGIQDKQYIHIEKDLTRLPSPYLTNTYPIVDRQSFLRWQTARGCPFSCSFCAHRINGTKVRFFQHERLYREIDLFCKKKVTEIAVLDPIFNLRPSHYIPLLQYLIKSKLKARLELQCRLELLDDEFLDLCLLLSDVHLEFGIQTLNETESIVINRKNELVKVKRAINNLNRLNLSYETHLIYGLPTQTRQTLFEGVNFLLKVQVPIIRLFPLQILRGTKLSFQTGLWQLKPSQFFPYMVVANRTFTFEDWLWARDLSEFIEKHHNNGKAMVSSEFWKLFEIETKHQSWL